MALALVNYDYHEGYVYTTLTKSITVASGSDRLLVVGIATADNVGANPDITGVTFNGTSMTAVTNAKASAQYHDVYWYYLIAPAVTTANVVATIGASSEVNMQMVCRSYTGHNGSAPVGNYKATDNGGSVASLATTSITWATNDIVLVMSCMGTGALTTSWTGGPTEFMDDTISTMSASAASMLAGSSSSGAFTSTPSAGSYQMAISAIVITPLADPPTIVSVTPSDPYPGELVSIVTSGFTSAPLTANCAYNGVGLTLEAGATTTLCTAYWPALSTFLFGASHAATAWDTNYTLTIANASESDTHTVQTTAPLPGNFGIRNALTPGYTLDTYNTDKVLATSDLVYGRITVGTATINAPYVDFSPLEAAVTVLWRFWDISQTSWSTETTTTYTEGFTLTSSDTTVAPGQTITATLVGGPFAGAITAAYAVYGVHEIPLSWTVLTPSTTSLTMPSLSSFVAGQSAEYLPWYASFTLRIVAGEESADTANTNQVVAPTPGDYGTVAAPPWGYAPSGAQEGDASYGHLVSGAGTFTPETFDFTESEDSSIYYLAFSDATQSWLTLRTASFPPGEIIYRLYFSISVGV